MRKWPDWQERFRSGFVASGEDECWPWMGTITSHGYGQIYAEGRYVLAHRLAYTVAKGPIPEGLFIIHSCDNPRCVNPNHLRAGTHADNMADMARRGRLNSTNHWCAQKTHCKNGHEFTPENTLKGWRANERKCAQCCRDRQRRYNLARKAVKA